jgi:hypothetical protein
MNPEQNDPSTDLEAILLTGMEGNTKLDDISSNIEASIEQQSNTNKAIGGVEDSVDIQTQIISDGLNALAPSMKAIASAQDMLATLVSTLTGPKGERGEKGESIKGEKGDRGEKGEQGVDGKDGRDGINGLDGRNGLNGKDGRDGVNGKDGKDGVITKVDYKKIISEVVKKIPEVNVDEKIKEIVDKVSINTNDTIQSIRSQRQSSQSVSMADLTDAKSATVGQIMIKQANGSWLPGEQAGGGGAMVTTTPTSPTINGSNTSFSFSVSPKIIITDTGVYVNEASMQNVGVSGFTVVGSGPYTVTLPIGPNFFIIAYS